MKKIVWGTRTLARQLGVKRDDVRYLIDSKRISPSRLKKGGSWYNVFDEKEQKQIEKLLNKKKKTD